MFNRTGIKRESEKSQFTKSGKKKQNIVENLDRQCPVGKRYIGEESFR